MVLPSIPSQMTRSCTCTVTARTPPQQPLSWQTALSMSANGWPPMIDIQHRQDRAPLDWVAAQPVPIPGPGSSSATGRRHYHSARPGPAARGHHLCRFKSWPSRVHCQCDVLPFVTLASTSTSFTRHFESTATLVHAFVTSRLDYCNILLAGSLKTVIDKLQRVMNAAPRIVSGTRKYDRGLTQLLHAELHWLDVADRVTYKLGWMVYKCLHGQAPDYLAELCMPVPQVAERQHLRSASRNLLVAPRFQLNTYGRRAFAVAAPATWNSLSDELRNSDLHSAILRRNFNNTWCIERIRGAVRLCAI